MTLLFLFLISVYGRECAASSSWPHILWWHSLGQDSGGWTRECGDISCRVSTDREAWRNGTAEVILFYGTDLTASDLPLPRRADDVWALLMEESPVNKPMLFRDETTRLFNVSATFQRTSEFPLVGKEILNADWLTSQRYLVPVEEKNRLMREEALAPIIYVQSNCMAASDRDAVVKQLAKWVKIDSYGQCVNNKQLPESLRNPVQSMFSPRLYELIARYKFALAFENFRCDDYLTEKFWRSLHVGAVPIVLSTLAAKDLAPDNRSAIFLDDFAHVEDLARFIAALNANDTAYAEFLAFKRRGRKGVRSRELRRVLRLRGRLLPDTGVEGENSFEAYECHLCALAHRRRAEPQLRFAAGAAHCPPPKGFAEDGRVAWDAPYPLGSVDYTTGFLDARWEGRQFRAKAQVRPQDEARDEL